MAIKLKKDKEARKIPKKEKIFLVISLLFFLLVSAAHLVVLEYSKEVRKEQHIITQTLKQKETEVLEIEKWESVFNKDYQKISFMERLINERAISENFFNVLEAVTHPNVYFSRLELNTEEKRASLEGVAHNFRSFGQQVEVMREKGLLTEGDISGVMNIKITELGDDLDKHFIRFSGDNGRLIAKFASPEGETIREEEIELESVEEDISDLLDYPVKITTLQDITKETLDEESVHLSSENMIEKVNVLYSTTEDGDITEEDIAERELPFYGEVDFHIRLKLNPRILGIK